MNKKIILVGKSASGKDFLSSYLEQKGMIKSISYTTRPKRYNETNTKEYYFIENNEFNKLIKENFFYEFETFNGWYYGSSNNDFNKCNLFIKTRTGLSKLTKKMRSECVVVYLNIDAETRRKRLELRNSDADSIDRRMLADDNDFLHFTDYDLMITESKYNVIELFDKIKNM
jgi:guanylate kinase